MQKIGLLSLIFSLSLALKAVMFGSNAAAFDPSGFLFT